MPPEHHANDTPAAERIAPRGDGGKSATQAILVGLVGCGIGESQSPALHEREGRRHGLRYVYRLIDLEGTPHDGPALAEAIETAERAGFAGINVTHPFKQSVIPLLHELSPEAAAIGAVNTLRFSGGRRIGHNTDLWGFAESFRRDMTGATLAQVLLCGAGGAGAAVARALLEAGTSRLHLFDRDRAKAESLVVALRRDFGPGRAVVEDNPGRCLATADGMVNATPVGMAKHPGLPVPAEALTERHWVADIVYFPTETALLATARRKGCRTLGGAEMAALQAAKAFELFTGRAADADAMVASLLRPGASRRESVID